MENNNNYVDKYERILAERRQRLRYLADKIQLFDSEVCIPRQQSSVITPQPTQSTNKEKENIPTPKKRIYNGNFYGPNQFITPSATQTQKILKTNSNLTKKFEHKTPPRDEIEPTKGHVAQKILNLEALEAQKNKYELKNWSRPDYTFKPTFPEHKVLQTELNESDNEKEEHVEVEHNEKEEHVEGSEDDWDIYENELYEDPSNSAEVLPQIEDSCEDNLPETSLNESWRPNPPKSKYETVKSSNVTEFQMLNVPEIQRMSTQCESKEDTDHDFQFISKFPSIYPTPASLVEDLLAQNDLIKAQSSVVLNTVHSETYLSESDLKSSLLLEEAVIQQVMKALRIYSSLHKQQFSQSSLHAECSRLLLIATQRKASILGELKSRQGSKPPKKSLFCFLVKVDSIRLQLKRPLVGKTDETHYFVCLLKNGHRIVSTELRSSADFVGHSSILFADVFHLSNLPMDFKLTLEVHYMSLANYVPNNMISKMTPKKLMKRRNVDLSVKPLIKLGSVVLCAFDNGRRFGEVGNVPSSCVLNGGVRFNFNCSIISSRVVRCFMTFREGTSSWDRRWCLLCEAILKMWHYPDDETNSRIPIRRVDLIKCLEGPPRVIPCEECPRPFTFEMHLREGDVIRACLVSADSGQVMNEMFDLLNALWGAVSVLTRR